MHQRVCCAIRSAIHDSQEPTSSIGFLSLKHPPPRCALLLVECALAHIPAGVFWYVLMVVEFCPGPRSPAWDLGIESSTYNSQFKTHFQSAELWSTQTVRASQSQTQRQTFWIRCQALLCILRANLGVIGRIKSTTGVKCRFAMFLCCMGQTLGFWILMFPSRPSTSYNCVLYFHLAGISSYHPYRCYNRLQTVAGVRIQFLTSVKHLIQITWPRFTPAVRRLLQHISLRAPWRPSTAPRPRHKIISISTILEC